MRFAIVDPRGNVVNVVEWDGVGEWRSLDGTAVQNDIAGIGWTFDGTQLKGPPPPPPPRRLVASALIIDRLQAAGLLGAARAALDVADLYTRERWNARSAIHADDPDALALLKAIGADLTAILAP